MACASAYISNQFNVNDKLLSKDDIIDQSKDCDGTCSPDNLVSGENENDCGEQGYNPIDGQCEDYLVGACNEQWPDGTSPGNGANSLCGRDICGMCEGPGQTTYYQDMDGDSVAQCGVSPTQDFCPPMTPLAVEFAL